jgi:hypothetical protein
VFEPPNARYSGFGRALPMAAVKASARIIVSTIGPPCDEILKLVKFEKFA